MPGKCYERCRIQDSYDIAHESVHEYTGVNPDQKGVELRKIIVSAAKNKWIKRKMGPKDGCCMSADQICYVWALKEIIPAQVIAINVVTDTVHIKDFQLRDVIIKTWNDSNLIEWREVICESDPDYNLIIRRIQDALNQRGYDTSSPNYGFDNNSKNALYNFQRENSLPLGHLDLETLAALDIF